MARKLTYNINRFDGGMTSSTRDVTQRDRFAFLSHFDIYRDTGKMYVMPGYVSDDDVNIAGTVTPNGLRTYDVRAFNFAGSTRIFALGTKSDGTGSKIFQKDSGDTEWKIPTTSALTVEGTKTITDRPLFLSYAQLGGSELYFTIKDGTPLIGSGAPRTNIIRQGPNVTGDIEEWKELANTTHYSDQIIYEEGFDGKYYVRPFSQLGATQGIAEITSSNITLAKATDLSVGLLKSGDYQIGYGGVTRQTERQSRLVLWDSASLLADQNISLSVGSAKVLGYPSNLWAVVMSEYTGTSSSDIQQGNGSPSMSIKLISGETPETIYREFMPTNTNSIVEPVVNGGYRDAMAWYARIPTNSAGSTFRQGIWSLGRSDINSRMGVSVLLNTEPLGRVETCHFNGYQVYFAHNENGSVSKLDNFDTGTYDVTATAETVWYGTETPYQKELNGISVVTNPLPASASVKMYYRINDSASWTLMDTSSTTEKMKHQFARVSGTPIGKFQEIQFKMEVLGKVEVQNIFINLTETDDLAF